MSPKFFKFIGYFSLLFLIACNEKQDFSKTFTRLTPKQTHVKFSNDLTEDHDFNVLRYQYIYNGAGVATGDLNNDGLPELFFTGNMVQSKLYLNKGNLEFEDISENAGLDKVAGWNAGVTMADVNNDGWLDIYVSRDDIRGKPAERANLLLINNGDLTFTDRAAEYKINDMGFTNQAAFFDMDLDGDLDVYLAQHMTKFKNPMNLKSERDKAVDKYTTNRLYRNDGGKYTDITEKAGVESVTFSLGLGITDVNRDGYPDIYVANDYVQPDRLLINNKDGTFSDRLREYFPHIELFGMGIDWADYNNDGLIDLIALDMLPETNHRQKMLEGPHNWDRYQLTVQNGYHHQLMKNVLQINNGNGTFSDVAWIGNVAATDWSWNCLFADFDNDGNKDLVVTKGYRRDYTNLDFTKFTMEKEVSEAGGIDKINLEDLVNKMPAVLLPNFIFKNNGDLTFTKMTEEWGLTDEAFTTGCAYADLDNDGDLEIIMNNIDDVAYIYQNNTIENNKGNNWIKIKFDGEKNKNGLGCKVTIWTGDQLQYQECNTSRGYFSAVEPILHFGLGEAKSADKLLIEWPGGAKQIVSDIATGSTLVLKESDAVKTETVETVTTANKLFTDISATISAKFRHNEDGFIDFKREPLLPHLISRLGPGIAVGDVNGDGLDDFFIGGASRQTGKMFLQKNDGTFLRNESEPWNADSLCEDMAALLFDADADNDLDLYVVSGGNFGNEVNYSIFQDRLYINNGNGNFSKSENLIPEEQSSGSCVVGADYDKDGDIDLFVGGALVPYQYPLPALSFLLRNDGGKFINATMEVIPSVVQSGMVRAALWTDFDNDLDVDLMVTGEWMPVMFFRNDNGKFSDVTNELAGDKTNGWWNSIASADFDHDGDMDYALGNYSLNNKLKASADKPASIVAGDMDKNGSLDAICSYYIGDKSYPIAGRDDLLDQMIYLKKKYRKYIDYADLTVEDIFEKEKLDQSYKTSAYHFEVAVMINNNGKFEIKALPLEAQFSCVYGIQCADFDNDGNADILLVGNSYSTNVKLGRNDAGIGLYLTGDGAGNFLPQRVFNSGFYAPHDAKSLAMISSPSSMMPMVLVGNNDDFFQVFKINDGENIYRKIKLHPGDWILEYKRADGTSMKIENALGGGYLSQNSRQITVPFDATEIFVTTYSGEKRPIQ